jgi:ketosteroid isomerase-like protein
VSHATLAVVQQFYDMLDRGDVPTILDALDPGVHWQAPESMPWGGTFHGHAGFQEFLGKLLDQPVEWGREVQEILDTGSDKVVARLTFTGRPRNGQPEFGVPEVHVWTVRDGKVSGLDAYFDTAIVLREREQ